MMPQGNQNNQINKKQRENRALCLLLNKLILLIEQDSLEDYFTCIKKQLVAWQPAYFFMHTYKHTHANTHTHLPPRFAPTRVFRNKQT